MMIETLFHFLPLSDAFILLRYEKISNLIESLERTFEAQGYISSLFFFQPKSFFMLELQVFLDLR